MMKRLVPVLFLSACSSAVWLDDGFTDGVQPLFGPAEDSISSPYLLDASFDLELKGTDDVIDTTELVSSDPSILLLGPTITTTEGDSIARTAVATAVGAGRVTIEAVDDNGRVRHSVEVAIAVPDLVELHPVQRLVLADTTLVGEPANTVYTALTGSPVDYELWPFSDGDRLTGSAVPTVRGDALTSEAGAYRTRGNHDVIQLTLEEPGTHSLTVDYPSGAGFTHTLTGEDTVTALEILCNLDDEVQTQSGLDGCIAHATATGGANLYGVFPAWTENGTPLSGEGEFIQFERGTDTPEEDVDVIATFEGLSTSATYAGVPGATSVRNSNDITTCSHANPSALWLMGPGLVLLGLRRRS